MTDSHCHCGSPMSGSDHCPFCGCEEYESYCDENFVAALEYDIDTLREANREWADEAMRLRSQLKTAKDGLRAFAQDYIAAANDANRLEEALAHEKKSHEVNLKFANDTADILLEQVRNLQLENGRLENIIDEMEV